MSQKLSDALKEVILEAFEKVDENNNGYLGKSGLRRVLQHIGQNPTKKDMRTYMKHGKKIVYKAEICDFVEQSVTLKSRDAIDQEIAEAFAKFDTNENSLITVANFKEILTQIGDEPLTDEEADLIIKSLKVKDHLTVHDLSKLLIG